MQSELQGLFMSMSCGHVYNTYKTYILRNVIFICKLYNIHIYHINNTVYVYNFMCQYLSYIQL